MVVVRKVFIVSVHVHYFSFFSFFSLGQSGYVSLLWRDGTWSSTKKHGQDRGGDKGGGLGGKGIMGGGGEVREW